MARVVVVMGVAGSGKTTVAELIAAHLGVPHAEADEFHPPANIAKMSAGHPLTDDDRWPWLRAIAQWIKEQSAADGGVVTCSALKRSYRDLLREGSADVWFVHLTGTHALLADRIGHRKGHFMPAALLDSQLADLQPLDPDEPGVALDIAHTPEELAQAAINSLP